MYHLNPILLISFQRNRTHSPSTSTLCWKGLQWLSQEPSSRPTTEINTHIDNQEIRNAQIVSLKRPKGNIKLFYKLNRPISVFANCKRFKINSRNTKANKQSYILYTRSRLGNVGFNGKNEFAASSSLKTLHPFINKEGLFRVGGIMQQSTFPYQTMHQTVLPSNHHFTKLVFSADHIRFHHAGPQLLIAYVR